MVKYITIAILVIFLIYMLVWTFKLYSHNKRQQKVRRVQELRAKQKEPKETLVDQSKNYWYNLRELEACEEGEDAGKYYHYFLDAREGFKDLLMEMYDCGIVRVDELEEISYGKHHFKPVDLSFLDDDETEDMSTPLVSQEKMVEELPNSAAVNNVEDEGLDVIQVQGLTGNFFSSTTSATNVLDAAKQLDANDTGIKDIDGNLTTGMENVIAAVEAEKIAKEKEEEPILMKKEVSVEEAREARAKTTNQEVRNKVYQKWVGYVEELYAMVSIHADDAIKNKIRKDLMDYGNSDVEVLLQSPEE